MLWGIVAYFNPCQYKKTFSNFKVFSERVRRQNLKLLTIEVIFDDGSYQISDDDSDIVVRLKADSVLWHKERIFNIALKHLPDNCTKICWLDADILFSNENWVRDTESALEKHKVVQPFSHCIWLLPDSESMDIKDTIYPEFTKEGGRIHSFGFGWHHFGEPALEARVLYGHVGFAWAARREVIEKIGFYDAEIVGSGDALMAHAFVGCDTFLKNEKHLYPPLLFHIIRYGQGKLLMRYKVMLAMWMALCRIYGMVDFLLADTLIDH